MQRYHSVGAVVYASLSISSSLDGLSLLSSTSAVLFATVGLIDVDFGFAVVVVVVVVVLVVTDVFVLSAANTCCGTISQFLPRCPVGHSHLKRPSSSDIDVHLPPLRQVFGFFSQ